jgi:nucleoid DNA-binding protein
LVDTEFKFIFTKMDILSYLTDLLNTQKEVGVEGLGTFFKQKTPGRYDVINHQFVPPTYVLSFVEEITETSILSSYVSEKRNISEESARYYVGLFVEDINRQLAISSEADLDSLGMLTQVEDTLVLKPGSFDLSAEFYGFPSISVQTPEGIAIPADLNAPDENDLKAGDTNNLQADHAGDLNAGVTGDLKTDVSDDVQTEDKDNVQSTSTDDAERADTNDVQSANIDNVQTIVKNDVPTANTDTLTLGDTNHLQADIELEAQNSDSKEADVVESDSVKESSNSKGEVFDLAQDLNNSDKNDNQEVFDEITEAKQVRKPEPKIEIETSETLIDEEQDQDQDETDLAKSISKKEDHIETEISEITERKEKQDQENLNPQLAIRTNERPIEKSSITSVPVNPVPLVEEGYRTPASNVEPVEAGIANIWHFDKENSNIPAANSQNDTFQESKSSGRSFWIGGLLIALVVLAIVVAAAYFLKPALFGKETTTTEAIVAKDTLETTKPIIDTSRADSSINNNATANIDTLVSTIPLADSTLTTDSVTWEIIGASLTRGEVKEYIRIMKSRGYTAKPVPNMPGKRRIKMSIATFKTEESAKEGRRLLVKKLNNKDLYIYQNKNTQKPL